VQAFQVILTGLGVDHAGDDLLDLAFAAQAAPAVGDAQGGPFGRRLGELGLQGQGLAHGAGDAGEGEREFGGGRAVFGRLHHLAADFPRQVHADLGQFRQQAQMPLGPRRGGIGSFAGGGCYGYEQNENTRQTGSQQNTGLTTQTFVIPRSAES
jgi:hypothetical protein